MWWWVHGAVSDRETTTDDYCTRTSLMRLTWSRHDTTTHIAYTQLPVNSIDPNSVRLSRLKHERPRTLALEVDTEHTDNLLRSANWDQLVFILSEEIFGSVRQVCFQQSATSVPGLGYYTGRRLQFFFKYFVKSTKLCYWRRGLSTIRTYRRLQVVGRI